MQLSVWAHQCCPVGNGHWKTGANDDYLATSIAVCNSLLSLTQKSHLLSTYIKLWQTNLLAGKESKISDLFHSS